MPDTSIKLRVEVLKRLSSRLIPTRTSLRARLALGVGLPILLAMTSLAIIEFTNEREILEAHTARSVQQLGDIVLESLRTAMIENDDRMINQALLNIGNVEGASSIQIIDVDGQIYASSDASDVGVTLQRADVGCDECHSLPGDERTRTLHLSTVAGILRITTPILNEPDCVTCHTEGGTHLGMLLFDMSIVDLEEQLRGDLTAGLLTAIAGSFVVTAGAYVLMHRMVVNRVDIFRNPLEKLAEGDLSARVPSPPGIGDELDELADRFNQMASDLEEHTRAEQERTFVREHAIVEERKRIARELHDGLSQLLGFVNTKAIATRLLLEDEKLDSAGEQLTELEQAARESFIDVRAAILGLHSASTTGEGLANSLKDYTSQFSRLTTIPVDLEIDPKLDDRILPPEIELQLLRIVQEALTNIRKHASASQAWIRMSQENHSLELSIWDDGVGFEPGAPTPDAALRFGLDTMRERAETIGAQFRLDSSSGDGTRIVVRIHNQED
jgi:signal transduction histidine kinase